MTCRSGVDWRFSRNIGLVIDRCRVVSRAYVRSVYVTFATIWIGCREQRMVSPRLTPPPPPCFEEWVRQLPPDFYERWVFEPAEKRLAETAGALPPERWLQQIWRHQRLQRNSLVTTDGRAVQILHPGFWNREPGPDFKQALIQLVGAPPRSGAVEIDVEPRGWKAHGHHRNPSFQDVILHVVWEQDDHPDNAGIPTLALRPFLDSPIENLAGWLDREAVDISPESIRGQCSAPLKALNSEGVVELLRQASLLRIKRKAGELAGLARHVGWSEALFQGLCGALGYKHNTWPMRRVAEIGGISGAAAGALGFEARLLGLAGFLPNELPPAAGGDYARELWDVWWRERDRWQDSILPRSAWVLSGVRPANHPQKRLALAARWLAGPDLAEGILAWFWADPQSAGSFESLEALFSPGEHEFWSYHPTLQSKRGMTAQPLLGQGRAVDLVVNIVVPWLWARVDAGGSEALRTKLELAFAHLPAGEDNSVLKLARSRLLSHPRGLPGLAFVQQGLLQIVRDFCAKSDSLCNQCRFPELVRAALV